MPSCIDRQGEDVILYDDSVTGHVTPALFDPATWAGAPVAAATTAPGSAGRSGGRGPTLFIRHAGQDWVLRHYRRGGLVRHLLHDRYLWTGEDETRCFTEWRLLAHLYAEGLPVPRPVAAHYRRGPLTYTADLITVRIPGARSLSSLLAGAPGEPLWRRVGECIGRFHAAGVCHADLNAHNIQVDDEGRVFLLDFDRGRLRARGPWQAGNLARLQRSLRRLGVRAEDGRPPWRSLLEGYARTHPTAGLQA